MGRYDLNFYKQYEEDVEVLKNCSKGFIPVTKNIVKWLSKINPTDPETLEYLMLPLTYIPPIPLPKLPEPPVTIPEIPDLSDATDVITKLPEAITKLPDPALITEITEIVPKITQLAELDPSKITEIVDSIPTSVPDLSRVSELSGAISKFQTLHSSTAKLALLQNNINSLNLPSSTAFKHTLEELNTYAIEKTKSKTTFF